MGACSAKDSQIIANTVIQLAQQVAKEDFAGATLTLCQLWVDYESMSENDKKTTDGLAKQLADVSGKKQ